MKRDEGDKMFGKEQTIPQSAIRQTAPFAQGSHKVGHAPTAITKGSLRGGVYRQFLNKGALEGARTDSF